MDNVCAQFKQLNYHHDFNCLFEFNIEFNIEKNNKEKSIIYNLIKNRFHLHTKQIINWEELYNNLSDQEHGNLKVNNIDYTTFKNISNKLHNLYWDEYKKYYKKISYVYNSDIFYR